MGRLTGKLTIPKVQSIKKRGLYNDSPTLYLRVGPTGAKSWIQRIQIRGRRVDIGLGPVWAVSADEARATALENRKTAWLGGDPTDGSSTGGSPTGGNSSRSKRRAKVPTFREAAERVHRENLPTWKNAKHAANWLASLERYTFPIIGKMPVDKITGQHVLKSLKPIWSTRPERARRVRQRIRTVLGWCLAHGDVTGNAAGDGIDGALPKQRNGKTHLRALPYQEVASALATVEASGASMASKLCLRLLVLAGARSGEARGARWSEIDWDSRMWSIPSERMKAEQPHQVPLSDAAVQVLVKARALDDGSGLVFPSPLKRGRPLSDMSLTKLLRSTGLAEQATIHGMRSSFRDWCAESDIPRDLAEAALAHVVGGVEGAYFRTKQVERRRPVMQQWADYLAGSAA